MLAKGVMMRSNLSLVAMGLGVALMLAMGAVVTTNFSKKSVAQTGTQKTVSEPTVSIAAPEIPPGMRRVVETKTKVVNYTVTNPVHETHEKEITYTVMKPVHETREKTIAYTVCRMVPEVRTKTVSYTTCRMERETKQKIVEYDEVRYRTKG
jgi:hypothetical protein